MPKFRATVRISDLNANDPAAVQRTLEQQLKQAGVEKWKILSIESEAVRSVPRPRESRLPTSPRPVPSADVRGLFLVFAASVVAFWLLFVLE